MQRADSPQGKWWNVVFLLTAVLVVVADQLSKIWIRSNLDLGQSLPETGLFRLTHIPNTGAAFGLFQGQSFSLIIIAIIGIVLVLISVFFVSPRLSFLDTKLGKLALGLIFGGTVGNLVDRLRFGYVTDFIDIGIWPAFNIADSAITIGAILFVCSLLSSTRDKKVSQPEG